MLKKITLLLTLGLIALFITQGPELSWPLLIALPFASSLSARSIAYLDVFSWLREPFTVTSAHSSGVGNSVDPKPGSALGELLSCINCSGMWATALLLSLTVIYPNLGYIVIYTLAATSIGILFTRLIEMIEWRSCLAQEQTGAMNLYNKEQLEKLKPMFEMEVPIRDGKPRVKIPTYTNKVNPIFDMPGMP
jgi:hypothetical protein